MSRYTICFDDNEDADILRWMDAQVNKSMSLKALIERSIKQEGYHDIFKVAWERNMCNSNQIFHEPVQATPEYNAQQPRKKRGRPRKNASPFPTSVSVMQKIEAEKQNEENTQVNPSLPTQSDIAQSTNIALSPANNSEAVSVPEIPAEQSKEYISNKQSAIPENQSLKTAKNNTEIENDGYQRPGNVSFDMAKFMG
ncbi:hypothetical protein FMM75_22670 [Lachnospiraceae bacterium MD335]|nr:hypothetical protein [Lachnospiraceae bacterium MD335]